MSSSESRSPLAMSIWKRPQASPCSATWRSVLRSPVPAISSGGPGRWSGGGLTSAPVVRKWRPVNVNGSSPQTPRKIAMVSSSASCRRASDGNGRPRLANSFSSQPIPRPRTSRPPDRLSISAASRAVMTGWRYRAQATCTPQPDSPGGHGDRCQVYPRVELPRWMVTHEERVEVERLCHAGRRKELTSGVGRRVHREHLEREPDPTLALEGPWRRRPLHHASHCHSTGSHVSHDRSGFDASGG